MRKKATNEQYLQAWLKGIPKSTVNSRMNNLGYTPEEAVTIPLGGKPRKDSLNLVTTEEAKLAWKNGISSSTLKQRKRKGYSDEDAISMPLSKHRPKLKMQEA